MRLNDMNAYTAPLVIQARLTGASWIQIGRALGTTKQAAQRRFSKYMIDTSAPGDGA